MGEVRTARVCRWEHGKMCRDFMIGSNIPAFLSLSYSLYFSSRELHVYSAIWVMHYSGTAKSPVLPCLDGGLYSSNRRTRPSGLGGTGPSRGFHHCTSLGMIFYAV